ncbi:MAG: alkaline phosphatase family protein [Candidatus Thermoplasmatota archaeon]|nr:alkaline phosphatase family protein [Candidatus Thermoplasmatota archaeon]
MAVQISAKGVDFESTIEKYRWKNNLEFIKPAFGKGCITDIPGIILKNFNIHSAENQEKSWDDYTEAPDHLIFLLIDGFGFSTIKHSSVKYEMKYLENFIEDSSFRLITSVFPSTTSTATLSYHTNMHPVEHGVLGYNSYIPEIGTICNMISMNPVGRKDISILDNGYEIPRIRDHDTIHATLGMNDVRSYLYLPNAIKNSGLTKLTGRGASVSGYMTLSQMFTLLKRDLSESRGRSFHFCYISTLDAVSHKVGPYTSDAAMEIELIFMLLKEQLVDSPHLPRNTSLFISADHGHMVMDKQQIIEFNDGFKLRSHLLAPVVGEPRAPMIWTRKEGEDALMSYFHENYHDSLIPVQIDDLIKQGFFGNAKNRIDCRDSLGDVALLMKNSASVFDSSLKILDPHNDADSLVGVHGGLSSEEMIVPFITRKIA